MTAELRGAARCDGAQHFGLVGREHVPPPQRLAEVSDDVRDLDDGARGGSIRRAEHGCALPHQAFRSRQAIERALCLGE